MLEPLDPKDFDSLYALMELSFPNNERRSYQDERNYLATTRHQAAVVRSDDQLIAGYVTYTECEEFVFLESFAVDPKRRNNGLGGKILEELKDSYDKRIVLEVEPPETETARRRIGFYKRHGFFLNNYPYILPSLGEGKQAIPLRIMTTRGAVDEAEYEKIKSTLYNDVYQVDERSLRNE